MLIIYRKADRKIVWNSGLNSIFPEGTPFEIEIRNVIQCFGGAPSDYGEFRLHDIEQSDLTQKCFTHSYCLGFDTNGNPANVIIGDPLPISDPEPEYPTHEERIEALELAVLDLVLGA